MGDMRLTREFYNQDVVLVAKKMLGKVLVRQRRNGSITRGVIGETEAYGGAEDLASHSRFGVTPRNQVMFEKGGLVYVYFIYGKHWMLNIVTGSHGNGQAVLIRSVLPFIGPGRVGTAFGIDRSFYGEDLVTSKRLWIEESGDQPDFVAHPRVGVGYAREWATKKLRFVMVTQPQE